MSLLVSLAMKMMSIWNEKDNNIDVALLIQDFINQCFWRLYKKDHIGVHLAYK